MSDIEDMYLLAHQRGFNEGVRYAALRVLRYAEEMRTQPIDALSGTNVFEGFGYTKLYEIAAELAERAGDDELAAFIRKQPVKEPTDG